MKLLNINLKRLNSSSPNKQKRENAEMQKCRNAEIEKWKVEIKKFKDEKLENTVFKTRK